MSGTYDRCDLAVKAASHPVHSRYAALEACAQALVAAARLGAVRVDWLLPFVRGVLKFDATHGFELAPLDLLVWCEQHPQPPSVLYAFAMNLVDPPQAATPPEVGPNTAVCHRFLARLAGTPAPGYFD